MAKKDLPAVDFHAVVARRDPALADRLAREGLARAGGSTEDPIAQPPLLAIVSPPSDPVFGVDDTLGAEEELRAVVPAQRSRALKTSKATRKRGVVRRAGGREAGRVTVYVPPELALRLRQYCFDHDRTMTDVAGEILVEALERRLVVVR